MTERDDNSPANDPIRLLKEGPHRQEQTPPPLPSTGRAPSPPSSVASEVYQAVQEIFKNVKINGQTATQSAFGIEFNIPVPRVQSDPVVSEVVHPPRHENPFGRPEYKMPESGELVNPAATGFIGTPIKKNDPVDSDAGEDARPVKHSGKKDDNKENGIDLTSKDRLAGESKLEHKVRMAEIKKLTADPDVAVAIQHGDTSFFSSGFVPVLFTRADGNRKILTYVVEDNSSVIEGAGPGEKTGDLPAEDSYYIAGEGSTGHPFKLKSATTAEGDPAWTIQSSGSSIANGTNGDMLAIAGLSDIRTTAGDVAVKITLTDLEPDEATINVNGFTDEVIIDGDEATEAWYYIGNVEEVDGAFVLNQGTTSAAALVNGFLNGTLCKVFAAAPSHPDSFT